MTRNSEFRYWSYAGPSDFTGLNGYVQPTLLAFDPENHRVIIAGGSDSGLFLSVDSGKTWKLIADGTVLPRPRFALFDHKTPGKMLIWLGTQGHGVWRLGLPAPA